MIASFLWYVLAALAEITGCFAFWAWLRLDRSALWIVPGLLALVVFALALTRVEIDLAGRAFAAYGGLYICASLGWMWMVESVRPDPWDLTGAGLCLMGAGVILLAPRGVV